VCVHSRERRKSESNPTHNGPEGLGKRIKLVERGDLLLFYDGYGDGSSWRREEERDSCASELLLLQSARPREMRH
jgi:hypothetical protein